MSHEMVLSLTEEIYDAASGGGDWRSVGIRLQALLGAHSGAIMVGDPAAGAMEILHHEGVPLEAVEAYRRHYRKVDLWTTRAAQLALRGRARVLVSGEMLVPDEEFLRSEFWNDFARPLGMRWVVGTVAPLGAAGMMPVGLHRPPGRPGFGAEERRLLGAVLPHLSRALQLRHRLGLAVSPALGALDALPLGVLVLDAECRVLVANRVAEMLGRAGRSLRLVRTAEPGTAGRTVALALRREERDAMLGLVRRTALAGAAGGALRLRDADGQPNLAVLVAPLPRRLRVDLIASTGRVPGQALVLLRDLSAPPPIPAASVLRELFGLTASEAAVARAVATMSGRGLGAAAAACGIAEATLKTHLSRIFAKTGAAGQADLVRLLAGLTMLPPEP
ncbi:hypothetical protein [Roseomonas rosulenta]|uniref:hypothetical protein n=1 Tax=Roseomonas rosulenta TaxID=2748667 RepID=UPI0018DFA8A1|nr:hypothetical protein [Roseomonas rosulenta]